MLDWHAEHARPARPGAALHDPTGGADGTGHTVSPSRVVTLSWTAPTTGDLPSRYQIQAGSGPGLSNLLVQTTPTNATSFMATAPPGTYYVRVAGVNLCGVGDTPSNEVTVVVP